MALAIVRYHLFGLDQFYNNQNSRISQLFALRVRKTYVRISRVVFVKLDEKEVVTRKLLRHFLGANVCSRGVHRLFFRQINGDG